MNSRQVALQHIFNSLTMAAHYHGLQKRKSDGMPYLCHLIEVADLLINVANVVNKDEISAAILHDIIEDTGISLENLEGQVSAKALSIITFLTEDKMLSLEHRRIEVVIKLKSASDAIKRVKLADVCSNVSQIPEGWDKTRLTDYYKYTDQIAEACKSGCVALFNEYMKRRSTIDC